MMTDNEMMDLLAEKANDVYLKVPREKWEQISVRFQALVYAERRAKDDAQYVPVGLTAEVPKAYVPAPEHVTVERAAWHAMEEQPEKNGPVWVAMQTEAGRVITEPAEWYGGRFRFWARDEINIFPMPEELLLGWMEAPVWRE